MNVILVGHAKNATPVRTATGDALTKKSGKKSALAMHAKDVHGSNFSLSNFSISIVKKTSPQHIRREEFRFIEKFRTIQLGLNRYKAT